MVTFQKSRQKKIIKPFENGIFPLHKENLHKENCIKNKLKMKKKEEIIPDG